MYPMRQNMRLLRMFGVKSKAEKEMYSIGWKSCMKKNHKTTARLISVTSMNRMQNERNPIFHTINQQKKWKEKNGQSPNEQKIDQNYPSKSIQK